MHETPLNATRVRSRSTVSDSPTAIFFDIGGVVLTNGWDRVCRRKVIDGFGLDWEEFADRHEFVAHDFETGAMTLADYLQRTVFYRPRSFTADDFSAAMFAASEELPGALDVVARVAESGRLLATLNNESRELNGYRIARFGLDRFFTAFLSSCYLGVKKPEAAIYRIALDVIQREPDECLFIDDRELNIESAAELGIRGILFEDHDQLGAALAEHGVLS